MPEFLAEAYAPPRRRRAAEEARQPGAPVRFLGAIAVPGEEICFWLYQAPTAGAVRAAMTRAGLRCDRITPAVCISLPPARLGPAPRHRHGPATGAHPARTAPARPRRTPGRPDRPAPPAPGATGHPGSQVMTGQGGP
jgi:hypothetical protein